jgi:hypothetical protein
MELSLTPILMTFLLVHGPSVSTYASVARSRAVLCSGTWTNLTHSDPRFVYGFNPSTGTDQNFVGSLDGTVYLVGNGSQTDYSRAGYTPNSAETQWTGAHLADLPYLNRVDRVPWYLPGGGATKFVAIPAWASNWRAGLIRASNSALLAFNLTEGGTNYPSKIRTSSFALAGSPPASWDETDPATNATSNILADMEGAIVDAQTLRNDVYIYGSNETWLMQFVGGSSIWNYRKAFDNRGAVNANCSIEVNGKHYVFGQDDLWMHDGVQPVSIATGRVREFIFTTIDMSKANRCFVAHNPKTKEIHFCYVSGDRGVTSAFPHITYRRPGRL